VSEKPPSDWRGWSEERKLALRDRLLARKGSWEATARPEQLPPEGDWYIWLLVGGRGSGKTRTGIEWLAEELRGDGPGDESAIVAPAMGDARDTCVEGPSGLLGALERRGIARDWNRSLGELRLASGAVVRIDGADDGGLRLQGHNFRRAFCDELGLWRVGAGERAWEESLAFAVRVGKPKIVVATTPKPTPLMRRLLDDRDARIHRMTTFDNAANLAPSFLRQVSARYDGTRLGRQELYGELQLEVEGALWRHEWIERGRVEEVPADSDIRQTVVGLDPADGTRAGAEQGLVVCAITHQGEFYVLYSEGGKQTPLAFLKHAVRTAKSLNAVLLVEKNHGSAFLLNLLEQAGRDIGVTPPYRPIEARASKLARATPVAALYERGLVHHVGRHPELEEEMTTFTGTPGERSPDRLDALVHALSGLMGYTPSREGGAVVVPWARAHDEPPAPPWFADMERLGSSAERSSPDAGLALGERVDLVHERWTSRAR